MLAAPILAGALIDATSGDRMAPGVPDQRPDRRADAGPRDPFAARGATRPDIKLDIGGVWLVGLALVAIIYPLIQGRTEGWPGWSFAMLAAGWSCLSSSCATSDAAPTTH